MERGTHFIFGQDDSQDDLHLYAEAPHLAFTLPQHEDPDYDPRLDNLGIKLATAEINRMLNVEKHKEVGDHAVIIEEGKHRRDYLQINETFLNGHGRAVLSIWQEMAMPLVKTNAPGTERDLGWERIPDETGRVMAEGILEELHKNERTI